jgi:hypothetical protein
MAEAPDADPSSPSTTARAVRTRDSLLDHLRSLRAHVLSSVDGLDDAALRRRVLPSGWSCLGMIKHLTYDEEVFWFQAVVAGDAEAIALLQRPEVHDSWNVPDDVPAADLLDAYREAAAVSDRIVAATSLDAAPAWWPGNLFGDWRLDDLEQVLQHMVVEVATHAGHLDAVRELIDGRQHLVLNG